MLSKYPRFGAEAGFTKTTHTARSDQAELQAGRHTEVLVRSTTKECSATKSDCSWGIEPVGSGLSDPNIIILDSIRLSVDDEPEMNYIARNPYGDEIYGGIDPDEPLLHVKCCIIRRAKVTLAITGKGNPQATTGGEIAIGKYTNFADDSINNPFTKLQSAIGSQDVLPTLQALQLQGANFRITTYTLNDTENDWQTFTIEYLSYIDADIHGHSVVQPFVEEAEVTPPSCDCAETTCCNSYRIEYALSATGYTEITGTLIKNPMRDPGSVY